MTILSIEGMECSILHSSSMGERKLAKVFCRAFHPPFTVKHLVVACSYLYELDDHLDRFLRSAASARITPPFDRATIRSILIKTTVAANSRNGSLRYWLSAGPGDFHLSTSGCVRSTLYAMVLYETDKNYEEAKVITTSVPIKPPQFATVKSVNYLPNALALMEAEERGTVAGIWLDEEGFIGEGPNMNVAFVNSGGVLLVPTFDKILAGCTVKRMLALASEHLLNQEETTQATSEGSGLLKGIRMGNISVEEARACPEMMLVGSGVLIMPVIEWDGLPVGDGNCISSSCYFFFLISMLEMSVFVQVYVVH